jgi:hypothetical protein
VNVTLWVIAGLLAAAFLASGALKLLKSKEELAESGQGWVEPFPPGVIKLIAASEVAAAVGLILPAVLDIATVLVPLAATGLVLIMIGAVITHARRAEWQSVVINLVLLALAAFVAWGRFDTYAF